MRLTSLLILTMITMTIACKHQMKDVWDCASKGLRYHADCLTPSDIHSIVTTKTSIFTRPVILKREGARYGNLFRDCDTNRDMCIHPKEAMASPACVRDCNWREVWIKTFCE